VKVITLISAVSVHFETVSKYWNKPKQTERGDYILSEKIPKQNRNCQCFGLFRFEPKEKKSVSQDTLDLYFTPRIHHGNHIKLVIFTILIQSLVTVLLFVYSDIIGLFLNTSEQFNSKNSTMKENLCGNKNVKFEQNNEIS
jgi:hypothetical protein